MSDTAKIINRIIERIVPFHRVQITDTTSSGGVFIEVLGIELFLMVRLDGLIAVVTDATTEQAFRSRRLIEGLLNGGVKRDDDGNLEVVK